MNDPAAMIAQHERYRRKTLRRILAAYDSGTIGLIEAADMVRRVRLRSSATESQRTAYRAIQLARQELNTNQAQSK